MEASIARMICAPARGRTYAISQALALCGVLLLASPPTLAQQSPTQRIDDLERKLEQSLKQIEQLRSEVSSLRAAQSKPAAPAAVGAGAAAPEQGTVRAARVEELERQVAQINESNAARGGLRLGGLPLHGFADVGAGYSRQANIYQTGPKGFSVNNLSLYLTPEFGDRVKSLVELLFEVDQSGDVAVDLERLQIGYTFSDAATVWAGRFHTPYGIWNTSFHHGQQIQTALSRPRFLEFEDRGGILPAHTVGAWLTGMVPVGGARLHYDVYGGNGPRIAGVDPTLALPRAPTVVPGGNLSPNSGGDDNHSALVGFRAEIAPRGALEGLKLGVHALRFNVNDDSVALNRTRVLTYGPYASYVTDQWEILAEGYKFRNRDLSGATGTYGSSAWYAQAGYNTGRVTPYLRYERAALHQADNYFAFQNSGRSYSSTSLGLRFDLNNSTALKFEAGRTTLRGVLLTGGDDHFSEFRTQFSVRF